MKFINETGSNLFYKAIEIAENALTSSSYIMALVSYKNDWKYGTNMTGAEVVKKLCNFEGHISVKLYKSFNPWSAAIAYYDGKDIYFNTRKLSKSPLIITSTLVHEWSHHCGFKHGNNYKTKDKCLYSVPYFLSENI